jgi:hypothetical protein
MRVDMLETFDGKDFYVQVNPSAMKDIQTDYANYASVLSVVDPTKQIALLN